MNQVAVNPSNVLYLWPLRTLYIGQLGRLSPMSQGAHALMFALDAPLSERVVDMIRADPADNISNDELAAGFSDSSHLTHVFRSMLGMKPSMVLRRSRDMRILVGTGQ